MLSYGRIGFALAGLAMRGGVPLSSPAPQKRKPSGKDRSKVKAARKQRRKSR